MIMKMEIRMELEFNFLCRPFRAAIDFNLIQGCHSLRSLTPGYLLTRLRRELLLVSTAFRLRLSFAFGHFGHHPVDVGRQRATAHIFQRRRQP